MEKAVRFTSNAWKFYNDQSVAVKKEFDRCIVTLSVDGRLSPPDGKNIAPNLFEIRVKVSPNQYRMFYCYVDPNDVWILSGYVKKTQKAPVAEINKAKKIKRAVEKGV